MSSPPSPRTHWSLTILRANSGLRALRPAGAERTPASGGGGSGWRPLVAVSRAADDCHAGAAYEVKLGADGQNPNLRDVFLLELDARERLQVQIFHCGQTKKKSKRHALVAQGVLDVRAVLARHGHDARLDVPLVLHGQVARMRKNAGPAMQPALAVRLQAPTGWASTSTSAVQREPEEIVLSEPEHEHGYTTSETSPTRPAFPSCPPSEDELETPRPPGAQPPTSTLRRRRKRRGYSLFSDDEAGESGLSSAPTTDSEDGVPERLPPYDDELETVPEDSCEDAEDTPAPPRWWAAALLPTYVSPNGSPVPAPGAPHRQSSTSSYMSIASTRSAAESFLDTFTPLADLRRADASGDVAREEAFARVLERLKAEWNTVGGALVALAALDAAVFGFSSGSIFVIDELSARLVALSSVASALGLCSVLWFNLMCAFKDGAGFQVHATDALGTYALFSLSARTPALLLATSALALTGFMLRVAWAAWPTATLVLSAVAGVLCGLQWLVFVLWHVVRGGARVVRAGARAMRWVCVGAWAPRPVTDGGLAPGPVPLTASPAMLHAELPPMPDPPRAPSYYVEQARDMMRSPPAVGVLGLAGVGSVGRAPAIVVHAEEGDVVDGYDYGDV